MNLDDDNTAKPTQFSNRGVRASPVITEIHHPV